MPKTKISEYSVTNSSNTDIEGINIDEGCAPSGINNAIRELMVHLKEFQTGASGDAFTFAGGVLISGTANTITGNVLMSGTNTITGSTTATFAAGAVGTPSIAAHGDTNTGIFFPAADTIAFAEGGAEAMRITSSGNVLINTTSSIGISVVNPKLQVEFTDYDASFVIKRNQNDTGGPTGHFIKSRGTTNGSNTVVQSGDTLGQFRFWGTDGTDPAEGASITAQVDGTPGNNDMPGRLIFSTTADGSDSPTERMRISSAGEVLVGGTTSVYAAPGVITAQTSGGGYFNSFRNDTSIVTGNDFGGLWWYGNDTTSNTPTAHAWVQAVASGTHAAGDNPTDLVFATTPDGTETVAEAARITQAGALVLKGGTTTAAAGVGIIFPATQVASANANCLDDYEQGTFTLSNGGNTTYTTRSGRYTKIGNFVKCSFFHNINTIGTGSATTLTGLPFAPSSTAPTINGGVVTYISGLAVSALAIGVYADNAGQIIFMTRNANDTNATTQLPAVMGNSFAVYAEVSYLVD